MKNSIRITIAALVFGAGSLLAHHSYGDYDRESPVTLEGDVKSVLWANPHITVQVETQDKGIYTVEFNAPAFMQRFGVTHSTFVKAGDHVLVK